MSGVSPRGPCSIGPKCPCQIGFWPSISSPSVSGIAAVTLAQLENACHKVGLLHHKIQHAMVERNALHSIPAVDVAVAVKREVWEMQCRAGAGFARRLVFHGAVSIAVKKRT